MAVSTTTALEPFGDQMPGCEPLWYQGFPSPYYGQSHVAFRKACREFVHTEIKPFVDEWIAKKQVYPMELHRKAFKAGLPVAGLAHAIQSRYPPSMMPDGGFDPFHELIWLDETATVGPGHVLEQCNINSMAIPPVIFAGSKQIQSTVVDQVISGAKNISLAITEPSAGSDVANIRTTAVREGDYYRVDGQKKWITGGNVADFFTLACRTGGAGAKGISLLLVDRQTPGLSVRKMETQFDSCLGTTFITLDGVKVPTSNLIGTEGEGFKYLMLNFNHERFVIAAQACRFARLCYAESLKFSLRRKTFGKPLVEHQMIREKLALMRQQIEALHDSNERVAFQYKCGVLDRAMGAQCAMLKVMASRTFEYCAREASQVFGGSSIVREGPGKMVEALYREVRATAIPGGSEEVLLDLAARQAIAGASSVSHRNGAGISKL